MPWVKLCDSFADHPKIQALTDRELRIHIEAMCHSARFKTDGKVAPKIAAFARECNALDGLSSVWDEVENGFVIHDWLDYNISRKSDVRRKKKTKKRVQKYRKKKRIGNAAGNGVTDKDCNVVTSGSGSGTGSLSKKELSAWFQATWNETATTLPSIRVVDDSRAKQIRAFVADAGEDRELVHRAIAAFASWPWAIEKSLNVDTFLVKKRRAKYLEWAENGPPKDRGRAEQNIDTAREWLQRRTDARNLD